MQLRLLRFNVYIINDSIFNSPEQFIICHQVNPYGKMGKGIALEIKRRFPRVYKEYKKYCESNSINYLYGRSLIVLDNGRYVANLFGQYGWTTDYDFLKRALIDLKMQKDTMKIAMPIAVPYGMSCGLANGDWKIVSRIIDEIFGESAVAYKI